MIIGHLKLLYVVTSQRCRACMEALPCFDISAFQNQQDIVSDSELQLCRSISDCLARTGCLVIRDSRVSAQYNEQFLDLLESYFGQPLEVKRHDARPELHYQVGITPSGVEVPRCLMDTNIQDQISKLSGEHKPLLPTGPDVKLRYMWRVGPRPKRTKYAELNAEPVIPKAFPQWRSVMDSWGSSIMGTAETVARMAAIGFGLEPDAFTSRMHHGPHLLAPTGVDLSMHGQLGSVLAGFHYDLNFMTLHGKPRFPGLFIWLRDGQKVPVRIPEGCILIQAGKQLEWLTGGAVQAGMHEVVVTEDTLKALAVAQAAGRSTWRVSSTVFSHIVSDQVLQPLEHFSTDAAVEAYPPMAAGEQVQQELRAIKLNAGHSICAD